ncbi:hypothetical protein [Mycoplasmopsis alligatoris]|uniref:Uncharacterized protein n=1 Tax=Mycoplasmopsis alligatoris A21JP2 TaxID=747682 RepID=D4XWN7_9BACT|nr:hypothetical protein [Mycoplasmopsis alligatoris]EFF41130.1 hypothetical protein MALL_0391 [Mycoplasmopsis alligatoris A21JP2]
MPTYEGNKDEIEALEKSFINNYYVSKVLSYISNSLVIIAFVVYLTFARHRIKVGYAFLIIWTIVFILLAFVPHATEFSHSSTLLIILGTFISIFSALVAIHLVYSTIRLHIKRKIQYYEQIKIHKQKQKNGKS